MKKHLLLLFSLGTIVPLSSCANTVIPTEYCTFAFDGTNCTLQGEKQTSFKVVKGETVNYTFVPDEDFRAPDLENKPETATYQINDNVGVFTMTIENDLTIRAISQPIDPGATYKFEFKGTYCTIFGKGDYTEDVSISEKAVYTINSLGSQYKVPEIDVIKDTDKDQDYKEGEDYTYTKHDNFGVIEFNVETPDGIYLEMHSSKIDSKHQVVWNLNNDDDPIVQTYEDGAPLKDVPNDPTKDKTDILPDGEQYAFTFTDWDWEDKEEDEELPTNVTKDYTFNACYKQSSIVTRIYVKSIDREGIIYLNHDKDQALPEDFKVDWGDGKAIVDKSLQHIYSGSAITTPFVIKIYGDWVTDCMSASGLGDEVYQVDLSSTITSIPCSRTQSIFGSTIYTVKIPYSVKSIAENAFAGAASLEQVIFEKEDNKLETIGDNAFNNCVALTSFEIPANVSSIGAGAFGGCESLTSFEIPTNVSSIGAGVFNGCSNLTNLTVDSNNKNFIAENNCILSKDGSTLVTSYDKSNIPNTITKYGDYSCAGNDALFSGEVTIPDNIITIGKHAFDSCTKITNFIFPSDTNGLLTTIDDEAFYGCSGLLAYKLVIPSYLSYVGDNICEQCSLSYILCDGEPGTQWSANWNSGLPIYKDFVSAGVSNNFEYIIVGKPDNSYSAITVKYDGSATQTLNIPNTYDYNGESVPNEVIGDRAFASKSSLFDKTTINIPKNVVTIGKSSFYNDYYISSVNIASGSKLKTIGEEAFSYAIASLSMTTGTINLENAVYLETISKKAFGYNTILSQIKIPSGVTEIGEEAFYMDFYLKVDVSSATSLETIGKEAFDHCGYNLSQVTETPIVFPNTIKSIGASAFNNCVKYKTADFSSYKDSSKAIPTIGSAAFNGWNDGNGIEILVYDNTMLGIFKEAWPAYADNIKIKGQ